MNEHSMIGHTRAGTVGGLFTVLLVNITAADIIKTIVMAAIGAMISFFVSLLLKYLVGRIRK